MSLYGAIILAWLSWDSAGFFEWLGDRPWYAGILTEWLAMTSLGSGQRGLEVGSGPGGLSRYASECGVVMMGVDRSTSMVERARRNAPELTFVEGDVLALPMDDSSFDLAFGASVVNVVDNPQKMVGEMTRVVRSGGLVSVLFPTPRLAERAAEIGARRGLRGLSGAALQLWGSKAPKREPAAIETLFREAGLSEIRTVRFLDDAVASVTGRVP